MRLLLFALLPQGGCVPCAVPRALAHLVQDGDPRGLGEFSLQQRVWVDDVRFHVGGVARQQVGQADARGPIAWGERVGSEGRASSAADHQLRGLWS